MVLGLGFKKMDITFTEHALERLDKRKTEKNIKGNNFILAVKWK